MNNFDEKIFKKLLSAIQKEEPEEYYSFIEYFEYKTLFHIHKINDKRKANQFMRELEAFADTCEGLENEGKLKTKEHTLSEFFFTLWNLLVMWYNKEKDFEIWRNEFEGLI